MAKAAAAPPAAPAAPAEYTVLARRYRPKQFAELVGQEAPARALMNALSGGRVAHAYLFTGARGVGKTSTARILAKALNCEKGPTPTPCDQCRACLDIANGSDLDVLEIDGASNRGIDEVRAIRQEVGTRPSRSRYKVYIIDEVHMLTTQAFNALLKTLEEPPPHVKFIFATTEVQKIPVTILSRCQRFDFGTIAVARIQQTLKAVAIAEGKEADDTALELVARRAGGSMRDAQSLLDQLLAFGSDRLTVEQVHALLGTAGEDRVAALAAAILKPDAAAALALVQAAAEEGLQLGEVVDQLIAYWRDLLLAAAAGPDAPDLQASSVHKPALLAQVKALNLDTILAGLDVLDRTRQRLRGSSYGRALVEMAVVRLSRLDELLPVGQLVRELHSTSGPPTARSAAVPPADAKKKLTADSESAPTPRVLAEDSLPVLWTELLSRIGQIHAAQLRKAGLPAISGPSALSLSFPRDYSDARTFCQDAAKVTQVEGLLKEMTGTPWALRFEQPKPGLNGHAELPPPAPRPAASKSAQLDLLSGLPLVQAVCERFGVEPRQFRTDDGFDPNAAPKHPQPADDDDD